MSDDDQHFWTGTERLSGHSAIAFARIDDRSRGPWGKVSGDRAAWVAVGLRAGSGIIDVAVVQGDPLSVGMVRPDEGGKLGKDLARSFGKEMNPEAPSHTGLGARLGRALGMDQDAKESGITIEPVFDEKARNQALALFPEDRSAMFGALVRAHPNVAPFVDSFQGSARAVDVRQPGVVSAVNAANGAFIGDNGKFVRSEASAALWKTLAQEAPGSLAMLEEVAAKGRARTVAQAETRAQAFGRLVEGFAGRHVTGDARQSALAWTEALAQDTIRPETRSALMGAIVPLSERKVDVNEPGAAHWMPTRAEVFSKDPSRVDALGAVVQAAQEMDRFRTDPSRPRVMDSVMSLSPSMIENHGRSLLSLVPELGPNPVAAVRNKAVKQLVEPASVAISGMPASRNPMIVEEMQAHAHSGIMPSGHISVVARQVDQANKGLKALETGSEAGKALADTLLFQHHGDAPLHVRAASPTLRREAEGRAKFRDDGSLRD